MQNAKQAIKAPPVPELDPNATVGADATAAPDAPPPEEQSPPPVAENPPVPTRRLIVLASSAALGDGTRRAGSTLGTVMVSNDKVADFTTLEWHEGVTKTERENLLLNSHLIQVAD